MSTPSTLADWLEYQQHQSARTIDLGLERVRAVATRAGLLPLTSPSILIGGTNGKGSTVALVAALARAAGLRVGTFTSPHLVRYNERIALDDEPVADAVLVEAFAAIEAARGGEPLTFFEYNALAALHVFRAAAPELVVLEVGLGGRLDATNIVDADVAVICSIGMDHREYLGDTLEAIGLEKAGILRRGRPAILGSADLPASIATALARGGAHGRWSGRDFAAQPDDPRDPRSRWRCSGWAWDFPGLPPPALPGAVQYGNAVTAIAAFVALAEAREPRWLERLDGAAVARALGAVRLAGRFQVVPGQPEWILDVAHNAPAAEVLARNLAARYCAGRTLAVAGILADKDAGAIGTALAAAVDGWILCTLDGARAITAEELRRRLPPQCRVLALAADVAAGCALARERAAPQDRIIVLGSFHSVGPALQWLRIY